MGTGNNLTEGIRLLRPFMAPEVASGIREVLDSGWIGEGPRVEAFERALASHVGTSRIVCVNSGTSAIELALELAGVSQSAEVITSPLTCAATNLPILHRGAIPRWADIDPSNGLINPDSVESLITQKTRAILCVELFGSPCEYDRLTAMAARHGIPLIADCAQSFGATYRGCASGSLADFACFSFQSVKTITTGDGGALVLRSEEDYQLARKLRWFGIDRDARLRSNRSWEYDVSEAGYKRQMNDIAAYIGLCQLPHLHRLLKTQRDNAAYYSESLANLDGVELLRPPAEAVSTHWLYGILVRERERFIEHMGRQAIEVSPVHRSNLKLTVFRNAEVTLPDLERFDDQIVCIPNGYWVSAQNREFIAQQIRRFAELCRT